MHSSSGGGGGGGERFASWKTSANKSIFFQLEKTIITSSLALPLSRLRQLFVAGCPLSATLTHNRTPYTAGVIAREGTFGRCWCLSTSLLLFIVLPLPQQQHRADRYDATAVRHLYCMHPTDCPFLSWPCATHSLTASWILRRNSWLCHCSIEKYIFVIHSVFQLY